MALDRPTSEASEILPAEPSGESALGRIASALESRMGLLVPALALGTTLTLGGCGKEPTPPISEARHQELLSGGNSTPTPQKNSDGTTAKVTDGQQGPVAEALEPYHSTGSSALGWFLVLTAAGTFAFRKMVPGDSTTEKAIATLAAGAGTFVGGAALCGGTEPTVALALGTGLNAAVTAWSVSSN